MQEAIASWGFSASFYLLAFLAVVSALVVVSHRNPVISALWLVVSFVCVAGIYVLLRAHFLAMVQILVYAGAVMVLFAMVVMLMDLKEIEKGKQGQRLVRFLGGLSGVLIMFLFLILTSQAWRVSWEGKAGAEFGTISEVGKVLFTKYLLPFEVLSLLLLSAVIAVIYLARRWEERN